MSLPEYYNLRGEVAEGGLGRRGFVHAWWRMYAQEHYWAPPYYPALKEALNAGSNPHLKRLSPRLISLHGIPREARQNALSGDLFASLGRGIALEGILACALLLYDPRRPDGSAYLALLHSQNTPSAVEGLLECAAEELAGLGARGILGPVGISPWIESGVLANLWNQTPPAYAAYNPPYLPDLMAKVMVPGPTQRVYRIPLPDNPDVTTTSPAKLETLDTRRLASDLLALLAAACEPSGETPPPDALEADFLLNWIGRWPNWGWLAEVDGQPAGFMLLQPDLSPLLRRTRGGRNAWQRLELKLGLRHPMQSGRIVFAGVATAYRRQGIASQLWQQAVQFAKRRGWESLSAGPLPEDSPAAFFCTKLGGRPEQEYQLYSTEL